MGAAGSGQATTAGSPHSGMGAEVAGVYQQVRNSLPTNAVEGRAVGYAAASVWTLAGAPGVYFDSVTIGAQLAESWMRLQKLQCPTQRIVLAGYSQGAMVMHRVVQNLAAAGETSILNRIDGVILIADGDRLRDDNVTEWGSASGHSQGVGQFFTAISGSSKRKLPAVLQTRVHSICHTRDPVCAVENPVSYGMSLIVFKFRVDIHNGYSGSEDVRGVTGLVTQRVARAL